jgi:hypothetical protein
MTKDTKVDAMDALHKVANQQRYERENKAAQHERKNTKCTRVGK